MENLLKIIAGENGQVNLKYLLTDCKNIEKYTNGANFDLKSFLDENDAKEVNYIDYILSDEEAENNKVLFYNDGSIDDIYAKASIVIEKMIANGKEKIDKLQDERN